MRVPASAMAFAVAASIARSSRTGMPRKRRVISRPMKKFATTSTLVQSERSW